MAFGIRRREFVAGLGGSAVAWPLAARAQQPAMPVIGFLSPASLVTYARRIAAFLQGLKETGFVEGRNVAIEFRSADGHYDRLPELAADLVRRQVALITATGTPATLAVKAATATIPIVFNTGGDPVRLGLVPSMNRPGGNVTGVAFVVSELMGKQFELLHELVPTALTIGLLLNPNNPQADDQLKDVPEVARKLGVKLVVVKAGTAPEIDAAFVSFVGQQTGALVVGADGFFAAQHDQLASLAGLHSLPTIYNLREYVEAGGLLSYGTSITEAYRQAGIYSGRILKGDKPADLPVMQSTKFELVINLKTARSLGLDVPMSLLMRIDEAIE